MKNGKGKNCKNSHKRIKIIKIAKKAKLTWKLSELRNNKKDVRRTKAAELGELIKKDKKLRK